MIFILFFSSALSWASNNEVEVKFDRRPNCETVKVVDWAASYSACYAKFSNPSDKAKSVCKCIADQMTLDPTCKNLADFGKNPKLKDEYIQKVAKSCSDKK